MTVVTHAASVFAAVVFLGVTVTVTVVENDCMHVL